MKRYYIKVTLLVREGEEELKDAMPINQTTAIMGRDTEEVTKLFSLLSRFLSAMQSVFGLKD